MSNFLAIATVTETLRQRVESVISSPVPGAVAVAERPEPSATPPTTPTVRVFLYQVTPNAHLRNHDVPTRRQSGEIAHRPRAALDLHYLLSFYGDEKLHEPQRMLGLVTSLLHSQPLLTRDMVQEAITVAGVTSPLKESDLADQAEPIKFAPVALNLEELSKLWSVFFQTPYVLSVAYTGTVVFIEGA